MSLIPKIIHQLWIGPKPPPTKLMDTWKNKHEPDGFEYIRWTEAEMRKRGFVSQLNEQVNSIREINGKADILRWELLYKYGGFFVDADAYCIEPVTDLIKWYKAFVGYENEKVRGAGWGGDTYKDVLGHKFPLLATGTMAFPPKHELPRLAIEWIKTHGDLIKSPIKAWRTVGPGLLTRLYWQKKWEDITILPSFLFLPMHYTGLMYKGHDKIFANQEWGSTKKSYNSMNSVELPPQFVTPKDKVSILLLSYNTNASFIKECLDSIKKQIGHIFFEVVWINDGSNKLNTTLLKKHLDLFKETTRFTSVKYYENECNKGMGFTLNKGVQMCSNELIIRMDSDDIMVKDRILKQYNFMKSNPDIAICGGQISMFYNNKNQCHDTTHHPTITWEQYKRNPSHWFMNAPTVCYRKSKVLEAGNYNKDLTVMVDDFEMNLRMLKKYGKIYNFPTPLVYYRIHKNQVTQKKLREKDWNTIRNNIIYKEIKSS